MGKELQTHAKVQCMWGTDNQNLCPPILGCYTHWTHRIACYYIMVALTLTVALSGLFSLSLILFPVPSASTLDVGHGPVTRLFLGLFLCLVPMTPCDTMLYWLSPN